MLRCNNVALCSRTRDNSARMTSLNRSASLRTLFWVAYLALALVFVQGVRLHVHTYSHDAVAPHEHQDQIHSGYSDSDVHADETAQIDVSAQSISKKPTFGSLIIALIMVTMMLLSPGLTQRRVWRSYPYVLFTPWRGCQPPPLRAPPVFS